MFSFQKSSANYALIDLKIDLNQDEWLPARRPKTLMIVCVIIISLALGFTSNVILPLPLQHAHVQPSKVCTNPTTRREWRSLSRVEKHDYLDAVQCLRKTNSRLGMNQTLYDDFPWIHTQIGGYCMPFSYPLTMMSSFVVLIPRTDFTLDCSTWICSIPCLASLFLTCLRNFSEGTVSLQRLSHVRT